MGKSDIQALFFRGRKSTYMSSLTRKAAIEKETVISPDFQWKDLLISFTRNQECDPIKRQLQ